MTQEVLTPTHSNLFAVNEIVVFRNVYFIRGKTAEDAIANYQSINDTEFDLAGQYVQKHVSSEVSHVTPVKSDADIVSILNETESPTMTLERFTASREKYLQLIHNYNVDSLP